MKDTTRRSVLIGATALMASPARAQTIDAGPVVRELADLVEAEYPDARAASAIARSLRTWLRTGRYAGLTNTALADRLTSDQRAIIPDQHLHVRYDPTEAADHARFSRTAPNPDPPTPRTPSARAREIFEPQNYGLVAARRLPGNIGLIAIDNFVPPYDVTRERYGAAMSFLADTWGVIIDLRENEGGHPGSGCYLMSYFFDREPFVLDRMVWRRLPAEENRTTRDLVGASYGERRPVAVAISHRTFSAAEAVAYDLQAFGRARVVGETSGGGANPGDFFNIGQGFVAFVPQGHAVNPRTNANWEGVGVRPDIPAAADSILTAAHHAVAEAALAQTENTEHKQILRESLGHSVQG